MSNQRRTLPLFTHKITQTKQTNITKKKEKKNIIADGLDHLVGFDWCRRT
jgi:hypothetical protein